LGFSHFPPPGRNWNDWNGVLTEKVNERVAPLEALGNEVNKVHRPPRGEGLLWRKDVRWMGLVGRQCVNIWGKQLQKKVWEKLAYKKEARSHAEARIEMGDERGKRWESEDRPSNEQQA